VAEKKNKETEMQLIQIGETSAPKTVTVMEMFAQLAAKEAEMIRAAREKLMEAHPQSSKRVRTNT
jgi:hypothetical protein